MAMELGAGGAWLAWVAKCCLVGALNSLAASYVFATSKTTAPGMARLRRWWPVLLLFTAMPLLFTAKNEMLSRACCAAVTLWLANFKLLLLVLGRGALVDHMLTASQFKALLLFPVLHKEGPDGKPLRIAAGARLRQAALERAVTRLPENIVIVIVASYTLVSPRVPLFFKTYSGAFGVHAFAAIWSNLCAAWVMWRHGLQTAVTWDRPWLQNSLSDFWSHRWNLAAAHTLRSLVFEPIIEGKAVRKVKKESSFGGVPEQVTSQEVNGSAAVANKGVSAEQGGLNVAAAPAGPAELVDVEVIRPPDHTPQFKATITKSENGTSKDGSSRPAATAAAAAGASAAASAAAAAQAAAAMLGPSEFAAAPAGPGNTSAVADTMEQAIAEAEGLAHNRHQAQDAYDHGDVHQSGLQKRADYSGVDKSTSKHTGTGESSGMDSTRAQRGSSLGSDPESTDSHDVTAQLKTKPVAGLPGKDGMMKPISGTRISEEQPTAIPTPTPAPAPMATTPTGSAPAGRGKRVPAARRLLALALTFAVSGLMHEILLLVCTGWSAYRPGMGRQMLYFMLQVPASIIEQQMARSFKKAKWTPPDAIAIPFTSLSLQVPGLLFFWSPIFNAASAAMAKW